VPYFIIMNAGDVYQLRATNDAPADLSGTLIKSSKPIAVFGSHRCANIPTGNLWFCDYIVEQLPSINTWGNDFYTAPLATRTSGDTFRLMAAYDNTAVSINGINVANLNRGNFHQANIVGGARITSTRPILVAQYANSADYDGNTNSDPFMLLIQATRHYNTGYLLCTPTNDFPTNYIQIIVPSASVGSVQVNGAPVGAGAFTVIPATVYSYARVLVAPGRHFVTAAAPFSAAIYGWAEYNSYGNPGCFFFGDVAPPTVSTPSSSINVSVNDYPNTPGQAPVPNIAGTATAADNCSPQLPRPTQNPPAGTLLSPGVYSLKLEVEDSSGNVGETNVTLTVVDPSPVSITCPRDITANCSSNAGAFVEFKVSASTTYDPNVPVVSTPPSGSFFPVGTTTVTNVATSTAGLTATCTFKVTVLCDTKVTATYGPEGLTLTWPATGALEYSTNSFGPWQEIARGVNSFVVPTTGERGFFRVRYAP
jgi:hypothetical protein